MKILKDHWIFLFKKLIFLVVFTDFVVWKNLGECCCHRWANLLEKMEEINSNFQIHFLYVGEGDSIVIKYHSQTEKKDFLFIVDAGEGISLIKKKTDVVQYIKSLMKSPSVVGGKDEVILVKEKQGKINIETFILTHPHPDHYWNMKEVFDNFNINKFFYYKMREDYKEMSLVDKFNCLQYEERVVAFMNAFEGIKQKLDFSQGFFSLFDDFTLKIEAIGPTEDHIDFNDNSIVLLITYKNFRFLLMGDAGIAAERELIKFCDDRKWGINIKGVDLIKIGHHGHSTSSCFDFVNYVKPKNVVNSTGPHVFSCGLCNWHERSFVMESWRNCCTNENEDVNIFTTQEQGNIVAFVDELGDTASLKFCRN